MAQGISDSETWRAGYHNPFCIVNVLSGAAGHSLGFEDEDLGSSPSLLGQ